MELVIGGAFQGKLAYALETYGLTESDVCDLAVCDPAPGYRCYRHLEALSRREPDAERYLPLFETRWSSPGRSTAASSPWTVRSGRGGSATACCCKNSPGMRRM